MLVAGYFSEKNQQSDPDPADQGANRDGQE
jgi:hypothetical protein